MKRLLLSVVTAASFLTNPVWAGDHPVVVEMFTSQGCSSCPPADGIFATLSGRKDVIAIALHVDYWDYIGWKDTFGNPAHADRQRAYAAAGKRRTIYTPQIIVGGQTDIVGANDAAAHLETTIAQHAALQSPVSMDISRDGNTVNITAHSTAKTPMTVHMLRLIPHATTQIERGENKGHTINYTDIAQDWTVLGKWDGQNDLAMTADVAGDAPIVVLIQKSGAGAMLAAARLD